MAYAQLADLIARFTEVELAQARVVIAERGDDGGAELPVPVEPQPLAEPGGGGCRAALPDCAWGAGLIPIKKSQNAVFL